MTITRDAMHEELNGDIFRSRSVRKTILNVQFVQSFEISIDIAAQQSIRSEMITIGTRSKRLNDRNLISTGQALIHLCIPMSTADNRQQNEDYSIAFQCVWRGDTIRV